LEQPRRIHEIGDEKAVFGRSSDGGFWTAKVENVLLFNGD
jgi:hypothetical protein